MGGKKILARVIGIQKEKNNVGNHAFFRDN